MAAQASSPPPPPLSERTHENFDLQQLIYFSVRPFILPDTRQCFFAAIFALRTPGGEAAVAAIISQVSALNFRVHLLARYRMKSIKHKRAKFDGVCRAAKSDWGRTERRKNRRRKKKNARNVESMPRRRRGIAEHERMENLNNDDIELTSNGITRFHLI